MKLDGTHYGFVARRLTEGSSYRAIAKEMGCDKDTVSKFVAKWLPELVRKPDRKKPLNEQALLIIDIETRPALAYVWDVWNVNIYPQQIVEDKAMLSFAAKWHGHKEVMFASAFHNGRSEMVAMAWELLDQADAVIHYNGYKFDVPHIQQEFVLDALDPPSDFYQIDLLKTMRTEFNFTSNKLDNIIKQLGIGSKIEHEGFALWAKCLANDPKAWDKMRRYNINDTHQTEKLFDRISTWVKAPNYPRKRLTTSKFWLPS